MSNLWVIADLTLFLIVSTAFISTKIDRVFSSNKKPKRFEIRIIKVNGEGTIIGGINSVKYTSKCIEIDYTYTDKRSDVTIIQNETVKILRSDIARFEIVRGE